MLMRQFAYPCMLLTASLVSLTAQTAQAGPLIDWLFHRPAYAPAMPVGTPYPVTAGYAPTLPYSTGYAPYSTGYTPYSTGYIPYSTGYTPYTTGYTPYTTGYSGYTPYGVAYPSTGYRPTIGNIPTQSSYALPAYGTYYGSTSPVIGATGYGYMTQKPPNNVIAPAQAILPANNPVTLVPDYRSTYARTPVTYYRPVMTTDPNTGSQVVALSPCSSYEYQTQRVPTWGLTQVYNGGATLPAVTPTAPIVSPTYSLPRGGIPLSGPVPATQPYATAYGTYPSMATSMVTPVAPTTGSLITPASPGTLTTPAPYTSGYSTYASNYGNYSALQPAAALPSTGTYPTTPYNPYYGNGVTGGSTGGGSTGSGCTGGGTTGTYVAPPTTYGNAPYGSVTSPNLSLPSTTTPGFSTSPSMPSPGISSPGITSPGITSPSTTYPGTMPSFPANPVLPPAGSPSNDPAAGAVPVLPPINSNSRLDGKPQLQNIVQQPIPTTRNFNPASPPNTGTESNAQPDASQGLLPIPLPEGFKEPRWNPGLLKEQDTTAATLRSISTVDPQIAWGSKPIRWASHKTSAGKIVAQEAPPELPPAQLRSIPKESFTAPMTEIPEVNFPAPVPARLELEESKQPAPQPNTKQDPKVDPKGRRTDVWK